MNYELSPNIPEQAIIFSKTIPYNYPPSPPPQYPPIITVTQEPGVTRNKTIPGTSRF